MAEIKQEVKAVESAEAKNYERRSVKTLACAKEASAHQKAFFFESKKRVEAGEAFAFVCAGCPIEIFEAMDIPVISSQWWVSLCAAKQYGAKMYGFLDDAGYRSDICSYCISGLACALDPHPEEGPWGGLPKPAVLVSFDPCECNTKIYDLMGKKFNVPVFFGTNTVCTDADPNEPWWDTFPHEWDKKLSKRRLEHAAEEIRSLISFLEEHTGKKLDLNKLRAAVNRGIEQNVIYQNVRNMVAETRPVPVGVSDTVGAIMQAQWHKGSQWAVDHAKMFYDEVKARVDSGYKAFKKDNIRMMWIGRGLWFNLAFYQHFEEKYGAGFVWSMYSATADGHIKYMIDDDPIMALAAKECGMHLHIPPWNNNWYLKEAQRSQIDGVVYLVPENCMNNGDFAYYITKQLEDNGYPVAVLHADPADDKKWNQETMTAAVEDLIENRIIPKMKAEGRWKDDMMDK